MIERLFNEINSYDEETHKRYGKDSELLWKKLSAQLDQDGVALLEKLYAVYIRQSNTEIQDAFRDGFCAAMELEKDYLAWRSALRFENCLDESL